MTTHQLRHRGRPGRLDVLHSRAAHHEPTGGLLVVVEGSGDERGVLDVAELLARRDRINAHLIGVEMPAPDAAPTSEACADIRAAQQRRLLSRTRQVLHGAVGRGTFWSTAAALGELVDVVAEETRQRHTRLVLVALPGGGTRRVDALIAIASAVDVPVLAVPRHQQCLPTRVLVATDFSAASARAARTAVSLLGSRGHLDLLHVEPEIEYDALGHPDWRRASADGIAELFDQLRHELDGAARRVNLPHRRTSIVKDAVLLYGEPAPTILDYASKHRNDLIVVGTRRVAGGESLPPGSVALSVLRDARCSVLIAPPSHSREVARPIGGHGSPRSAT